jgi:hypothetical protein
MLSDWTKVFELKPRFLFALWFLGLLLLFLPGGFADRFGVISIRDSYRGLIGFVTLASFSLWLVQLFSVLMAWRHDQKRKVEILAALDALSKEEQFLFAYCLDRNQRTVCLPIIDKAATSLCQKGLLESTNRFGDSLAWPFTIPKFVWKRLQQVRPQVLPDEKRLDPTLQREFGDFERFLHRHDRRPSLHQ